MSYNNAKYSVGFLTIDYIFPMLGSEAVKGLR